MHKLGEAMEIAKEQAAIQKEHAGVEVYVSFQLGGNPRTVRWMTMGEMDKMMEADAKFSADPRYIASLKKMDAKQKKEPTNYGYAGNLSNIIDNMKDMIQFLR